ncbi:hypothetical protein GGI04_002003 [Coemansia thaxteri]|uniref:Uncharacterized protein n=1 Tax=Coemansia thaxteri TaxID=2663907 RepID=A0A9W8BDR7_9FUNG|nr:hypothetical protein H4R26_003047 [Coemansia thaxteri]KAJ2006075.1 hypothetical protein GGI04_002003 [Coemansia thaxteri]KAJ2473029.1 hypothetical protein GGI02_001161 [Coemansia sp. RSA 2322]KAJ2485919.1 hypothetical protein EV174_001423 [Coemansia sp. RSA 2320]
MTLSLHPFFVNMWSPASRSQSATLLPSPPSSLLSLSPSSPQQSQMLPQRLQRKAACAAGPAAFSEYDDKDKEGNYHAAGHHSDASNASDAIAPQWDEESSKKARELVASIHARIARLGAFLQSHSFYKSNPLGGAMCAEYEYRIHQMTLLICTQKAELKRIMSDFEERRLTRTASTRSGSSSLEDWEEVRAQSAAATPPANDSAAACSDSQPPANNLATIRINLLKEVIEFSTTELKRIESSPLLAVRPSSPSSPSAH